MKVREGSGREIEEEGRGTDEILTGRIKSEEEIWRVIEVYGRKWWGNEEMRN